MASVIAFLTAYGPLILVIAYAILNLLVAIFKKNEKAQGILGAIRAGLEFLSGLEPRNSAGTIKRPFKKAGPVVPDEVMKAR